MSVTVQDDVTRKGLLRRLGAGIVGVSAAGILADRTAKVAAAAPQCCTGGVCPRVGCPPADPQCCWYCTVHTWGNCKTYKCCDRDCNYNLRPDCTVAFFVGNYC